MLARALPTPVTLFLAAAMLLGQLVSPAPAAAAKGSDIKPTVTALIPTVSPSGLAAYAAEFTNSGSSNITHLTFTGVVSGGTYSSWPSTCLPPSGGTITCALGGLSAQESRRLVFLVTPAGSGGVVLRGTFVADANQGNPNAAKVDTWTYDDSKSAADDPMRATVGVNGSSDFYGTWQQAHQLKLQPIPVGNAFQRTVVVVPPFDGDYPAIVFQQEEAPAFNCAGPRTGFGKTVSLTLAEGNEFEDGPLSVTVYYSSDAAPRKTPSTISMAHIDDDGVCQPIPRDCSVKAGFCFDARWDGRGSNKVILVEVQLPHNGKARGY